MSTETIKRQTKDSILSEINSNGGFDNFRNWNIADKTKWVMANYNCTKKLAFKVACEL
jgi:hypothetical protein